ACPALHTPSSSSRLHPHPILRPTRSPRFPYTTLFRSMILGESAARSTFWAPSATDSSSGAKSGAPLTRLTPIRLRTVSSALLWRSEEHTSELQSRFDLVCRLLLEKKNDQGIDTERQVC